MDKQQLIKKHFGIHCPDFIIEQAGGMIDEIIEKQLFLQPLPPKEEFNKDKVLGWYCKQVEDNNGMYLTLYEQYIDFIFGQHKDNCEPLMNVLKIKNQLTYNQFCSLIAKNKNLKPLLLALNNYTKFKSIYLTLNNWILKDSIR